MNKQGASSKVSPLNNFQSSFSIQSSAKAFMDPGGNEMLAKHSLTTCQNACSDAPKTKFGQRLQMLRMLLMLALPLAGVIVYASSNLSQALRVKESLNELQDNIEMAHALGYVIHSVQMERLSVVKYMVNRDRSEVMNMIDSFAQTEYRLGNLQEWPIENPELKYLISAEDFKTYLQNERNSLLQKNISIFSAIQIYNNANVNLIAALTTRMTNVDYEGIWQLLIAYRSLVQAKESYGIALSVGVERLYGKILTNADKFLYIRQDAVAADHLGNTFETVPSLKEMYDLRLMENPGIRYDFLSFLSH